MITTITCLIGTLPPAGFGVGVGEGDEPFTPPQPIMKARKRGLKKTKNTRLKVFAPLLVF